VEQELLAIPEHPSSSPIISWVRDTRSLVLCVMFCRSLLKSHISLREPSWSWSCGIWICSYLCNQCLSPLTLCIRIQFMARTTNVMSSNSAQGKMYSDTTLCDKVCQWLATSRWFSLGIPVSLTNKTDRHGIS
jgi:hypothetical protein